GEAHTLVSSGNLNLGTLTMSGDPTFFNKAGDGDINISGDITVGENLSIVASRNITASADANLTANDGGRGFNINLVAGADITTSATGSPADADVTVHGASPTGGSILLNTNVVNIFSRAVSGDTQGGNVTLAAYQNGGTGGQVLLSPSSVIDSSG